MRSGIVALLVVLLAACVTGERIVDVRVGMQRDQVVRVLGQPTGVQRAGDFEALHYSNRLQSGWSWDRADYYVILERGAVVEYGVGQVRQGQGPNTLVLVPIPSP